MRLINFHIERFRALETMDIVFHPMTTIIGENDVGKTSCMLALRSLFESKKLETDADYFMRKTNDPVTLEATFHCPAPTVEQAAFCGPNGQIVCRCIYPYNQNRIIFVRCSQPRDERLKNLESQKVDALRKVARDFKITENSEKLSKPEVLSAIQSWCSSSLKPEDLTEDWRDLKEIEFLKLLPDFVLVPVTRDLESNLKMTETSLFGKLFRPLLKSVLQGTMPMPS